MAKNDTPRCSGTTKKGKPCGARPLNGTDRCLAHSDEETRESVGFGGAQPGAGRPRVPTPVEIARRLADENELAIQRPYWRALGYDVRLGPDGPYLVELVDDDGNRVGGVKLHGTSKEGTVRVSDHEDLGAQIAAAEKILDRAYGRPKQATEISGPGGGPVQTEATVVEVAPPEDRRAEILRLAGGALAAQADEEQAA